jgi:hypothetical protein
LLTQVGPTECLERGGGAFRATHGQHGVVGAVEEPHRHALQAGRRAAHTPRCDGRDCGEAARRARILLSVRARVRVWVWVRVRVRVRVRDRVRVRVRVRV